MKNSGFLREFLELKRIVILSLLESDSYLEWLYRFGSELTLLFNYVGKYDKLKFCNYHFMVT